ncbi:TetR/AcrR family transcriptional regulator [Acidipropionibacterium acidipropionici]|uniref:TetR/AcrR family transcriptional regulator n=1 Tax=Acidipropionibacterium acidipropionici TaxID=1748 RepID=UPI00110BF04D|nr:TetR family transcriptional regulator [Acidipropionibacterium acidipropionici]QCV95974.1 TetR/AcrR family transcriptional regulator [Acidipropionibacterium acidipropionici]
MDSTNESGDRSPSGPGRKDGGTRGGARAQVAEETRARILDAAFGVFAEQGFAAPLRAVADRAGVSAALIVHYFGSHDGLRRACDERFDELTTELKTDVLDPVAGPAEARRQSDDIAHYAPMIGYLIRVLRAGDAASIRFVDRMSEAAEQYLARGVEAGMIRPTDDEPARARTLVAMSLGAVMLGFPTPDGRIDLETLPERLDEYRGRSLVPMLEIATYGYLTDSRILDALTHDDTTDHEPTDDDITHHNAEADGHE